ncbi:MAG: ABC transporter permease [Desulfobacteraceae bacterium]
MISFKRMWAVFVSRNQEFFRDKAAFGWNFLFPFLIVAGFGLMFSNDTRTEFKVGVFPLDGEQVSMETLKLPEQFKTSRYIAFIPFASLDQGMDKLGHHKIDILIKNSRNPWQYWINDSSPKGFIAEKIFREASLPFENSEKWLVKEKIHTTQIRYIDWLFPGILGMNMMFSSLYGVGYVMVRYRKNGVLKRLKATPVTAFEYLTAQMMSRVFLLLFTVAVVWAGCDAVFSFHTAGSLVDAAVVFLAGSISLVSMGLVLACRGTSEEFASGMINFISWPMMFLSEVWFSLEGAAQWVQDFSRLFPLTHMLKALRKIINDGAHLGDVIPEITFLTIITLVCLSTASFFFSWTE